MAWICLVLSFMSFAKVAPELRLPFIHLFNPRSSRGFHRWVMWRLGIWKRVAWTRGFGGKQANMLGVLVYPLGRLWELSLRPFREALWRSKAQKLTSIGPRSSRCAANVKDYGVVARQGI